MATIFQRKSAAGRKIWYLNWRDPVTRRRHREPLGEITRAAARAALTQKQLQLLKNPTGAVPSMNFNDFATKYLDWYKVQFPSSYPRVSSLFTCHLIPYFKERPINLVNRAAALEFRSKRVGEGASVATVNKELKALKAGLERACDTLELLEANPLTRTKRGAGRTNQADPLYLPEVDDPIPKYLTREQLDDLYKRSSPRNAALWRFMANTGVRGAEMRALKICDVSIERKQLAVRSLTDSPTKGRKSRVIPLNESALAAWTALVGHAPSGGYRGGYATPRVSVRSFLRWYENDSTRGHYYMGNSAPNPTKVAHLEGFELPLNGSTLHCLRHTFASHMVMGGCDLSALQRLMGHADIKTTMIYSHLARSYMAETTAKIEL